MKEIDDLMHELKELRQDLQDMAFISAVITGVPAREHELKMFRAYTRIQEIKSEILKIKNQ